MRDDIWHSKVDSIIGILFVGSFALGAVLIIWQAAFNENPLANAMAAEMTAETQLR